MFRLGVGVQVIAINGGGATAVRESLARKPPHWSASRSSSGPARPATSSTSPSPGNASPPRAERPKARDRRQYRRDTGRLAGGPTLIAGGCRTKPRNALNQGAVSRLSARGVTCPRGRDRVPSYCPRGLLPAGSARGVGLTPTSSTSHDVRGRARSRSAGWPTAAATSPRSSPGTASRSSSTRRPRTAGEPLGPPGHRRAPPVGPRRLVRQPRRRRRRRADHRPARPEPGRPRARSGPGVFVFDPKPGASPLAFDRHTDRRRRHGLRGRPRRRPRRRRPARHHRRRPATHNVKIYWNRRP